jgi:hypothetical protein
VQGRVKSEMLNMDTTGMIIRILVLVLMVMVIKNYKEILQSFSALSFLNRGTAPVSKNGPHPCFFIYQSFEELIDKTFSLKRAQEETAEHFLSKLKESGRIPSEILAIFHSFLREYQAVRFGGKTGYDLRVHLGVIEKKIRR